MLRKQEMVEIDNRIEVERGRTRKKLQVEI